MFVVYGLYFVEVCSLYAHFLESFYHKGVLKFVKSFSAYIEMIRWFLFISSLILCVTLINLQLLKDPCIPLVNPTLLMYCWILFTSLFLRILCLMFISESGL